MGATWDKLASGQKEPEEEFMTSPGENRSVLGSTVLQLDMDREGQSMQGWPMWS